MKFKNNTKESYADLKEHYEHTAVLKLSDGTYRAIHIQELIAILNPKSLK